MSNMTTDEDRNCWKEKLGFVPWVLTEEFEQLNKTHCPYCGLPRGTCMLMGASG